MGCLRTLRYNQTMKDELLTILRDREKGTAAFRKAAGKLSRILVGEMEDKLRKDGVSGEEIMVAPILRSGIVFLSALEDVFPGVVIGVFGIKRNEKTALAKMYYKNLPKHIPPVSVIVDPMLATGATASLAVDALMKKGVKPEKIYFLGIIAAREGFDKLARAIPRDNIVVAAVDPKLDLKKFVVPGLGDFGDRYFGAI